jgi:hypothetical protein
VKKLNLPTKKGLKAYESKLEALPLQVKSSLDVEMRKALHRLDIDRRTDLENLTNTVEKLKTEVTGMRRKSAPNPTRKTPARKTAQS